MDAKLIWSFDYGSSKWNGVSTAKPNIRVGGIDINGLGTEPYCPIAFLGAASTSPTQISKADFGSQSLRVLQRSE